MLRLTLGCLLLCLIGCTPVNHKRTSLTTTSEDAVSEPSPMLDSLHRLLDTPAASGAAIPVPPPTGMETVLIPTPEDLAHDGRRFTLHTDRESQLAWITINGGLGDHLNKTAGPWSLTAPQVEGLIALMEESSTKK